MPGTEMAEETDVFKDVVLANFYLFACWAHWVFLVWLHWRRKGPCSWLLPTPSQFPTCRA